MRKLLCVVAAGALVGGCADGAETNQPFDGPTFNLEIGALELTGVADAVWDIEVINGLDETVWAQRISSSQYGDGAGSASYVGPCDASENDNTVEVTLLGVYSSAFAQGADLGAFGADAPAGFDPINNPGTLSKPFTCVENGDVFVEFNVVVMRPAQQGFFDIAVNFNNIFCSAKFDCSYVNVCGANGFCTADGTTACTTDGNECTGNYDIDLLHNGANRDKTYVLGFACTAGGAGVTGVDTHLYLNDITVTCGENSWDINPLAADGNYNTSEGWSGVTPDEDNTGGVLPFFQVASYKGQEDFDGDYNKLYLNMAFGVGTADLSGCTLTTDGTADDDGDWVEGMIIPEATVYPYINWDINLATCTQHPVDGANGGVETRYTASIAEGASDENPFGAKAFDNMYNP